ncbi:MAG TPA: F0F1 ATP synthase subunit epsilon [Ignavibacteriaceae bacterium]|nr:F0F1 ATP synthase subunit epsilon [Ignavibacteriaceae bacterium]
MAELSLEIITPSKLIYSGIIKSITVPGTMGSFQVLVNHAPLLATFEIGEIKIVYPNGETVYYATGGGTIEVNNNKVEVLADTLETFNEIDIERAKKAKERAAERLKNRDKETDLDRAESALKRAMNRLYIVEKRIKSEVPK